MRNGRMNGGDPTLVDGISIALTRIFKIIIWALISATVGVILRMIQGRSNFVGRVLTGFLGMAWSAASYLVIPILVNENKDPYFAFGDSVKLLKKTWGEGLIGTFSFGLVFTVMTLPAFLFWRQGSTRGLGLWLSHCIGGAGV